MHGSAARVDPLLSYPPSNPTERMAIVHPMEASFDRKRTERLNVTQHFRRSSLESAGRSRASPAARLQRHLAALDGDLDRAARAALEALLVDEPLHLLLVARHLLASRLEQRVRSAGRWVAGGGGRGGGGTHPGHVDVAGGLGAEHVVLAGGRGHARARHPARGAGPRRRAATCNMQPSHRLTH